MLSAFVLLPAATGGATPALGGLVRTLGALVPASVAGLVRDVAILAPRREEDVRQVADHAGCAVIEAERFPDALTQALAQARSPLVLLIRAGAYVDRAFQDEVSRSLDSIDLASGRAPPALVLRQAPNGLIRRMLPDLAPVAGLIAPAAILDRTAPDFDTLVRRTRQKRTLGTRAAMML